MPKFGLIGYPLSHSFSKRYFTDKFKVLGLEHFSYHLFPLANIGEIRQLLSSHPDLQGLNVTIPYKESVLPFLHDLSPAAEAIGAVNTISISDHRLKGYNTDVIGFESSLKDLLADAKHYSGLKALVFGTGGASKAVQYVLKGLGVPCLLVSRNPKSGDHTYQNLPPELGPEHRLWINTTPVGMYPAPEASLLLDYTKISSEHYLFDLVYNPEETVFLREGKKRGAATKNGLEMLYGQAESAWKIWTALP